MVALLAKVLVVMLGLALLASSLELITPYPLFLRVLAVSLVFSLAARNPRAPGRGLPRGSHAWALAAP